ncbi:hypothetical protein LT493_17440 [Streptomyces tricolor]|nr:hypothetical protein [Streptomyces tricolor]
MALVCTNGKRDRCCALLLGRSPATPELVASGVHGSGRSPIWVDIGPRPRCSSCRMATPTAAPRRTPSREALHGVQEGRVVVEGVPGVLRAWERPGQAAELAVRSAADRGPGGRAERQYGPTARLRGGRSPSGTPT